MQVNIINPLLPYPFFRDSKVIIINTGSGVIELSPKSLKNGSYMIKIGYDSNTSNHDYLKNTFCALEITCPGESYKFNFEMNNAATCLGWFQAIYTIMNEKSEENSAELQYK